MIDAHIPPPIISQAVPMIKSTFDNRRSVFRLAMPTIRKIAGGPNVIAKQNKISAPNPSIIKRVGW